MGRYTARALDDDISVTEKTLDQVQADNLQREHDMGLVISLEEEDGDTADMTNAAAAAATAAPPAASAAAAAGPAASAAAAASPAPAVAAAAARGKGASLAATPERVPRAGAPLRVGARKR